MKKLQIAIVGLHFGRHILTDHVVKGPAAPYFELTAVCDQVKERADEMAVEYSVRSYDQLDDLLADPQVDVIGLFTGPVGRSGLLRKIIRAGKDVMTTKPLELDPEAALDVLNEADRLGRVIHLNSPGPVLPADIQQILIWQQEWNLGEPISARWETWVRYYEKEEGSWYDDPAQCPAAPVFRLGIYAMNDILALLGEPETVQVMQSRIFTGRPTADNAQMGIRFKNGALANIYASFCVEDGHKYPNNLVVNFARGSVYRTRSPRNPDDSGKWLQLRLSTCTDRGQTIEKTSNIPISSASGNYQWENFYRAVHGQALPGKLSNEQIVNSIRVVAALKLAQVSEKLEPVVRGQKTL